MALYLGSSEKNLWINGAKCFTTVLFKELYDILDAYFTEESIVRNTKATLIIISTMNVDTISMVNKAGRNQTFDLVSIENINGRKQWTVEFKISSTGTQSYTITGHAPDGTSGLTATASIKITRS